MASTASMYKETLQHCIQQKNLQAFYPPNDPRLDEAADIAASHIREVCARWNIPEKQGLVLAKLALFDVVLYIDNSASMSFEEGGRRIKELKKVADCVVDIVRLFDSDGFDVRFMNGSDRGPDNVKDAATIEKYFNDEFFFQGTTPLGTELRKRVLDGVVAQATARKLPKPVLVITITDGIPCSEDEGMLRRVILDATKSLARTPYTSSAISYQFAQVGSDTDAQKFLDKLDRDPEIGDIIDCTSGYEFESAQMIRAIPPVALSKSMWIVKLLVGAIDSSFDKKDEAGSASYPDAYGQPPPPDNGRGGYSQQLHDQKTGYPTSQQQTIPGDLPPSYDDSLHSQGAVSGQQRGHATPSSPHRSIFGRSKDLVRSFRKGKDA